MSIYLQHKINFRAPADKHCYFFAGRVLFFLIVLIWHSNAISAANRIWSGATSSSWTVTSNWVGNNLPSNGDNVLIPGGLTNYPVITTSVTVKNVTVNSTGAGGSLVVTAGTFNTAKVTVSSGGTLSVTGGLMKASGITTNGVFNMSGGILAASGTLSVNSGGVVNQSSGMIHMNANTASNPNDNLQINTGGTFNQSGGTIFLKDLLPGGGTFYQTGAAALIKVDRHWQMGTGSIFNSSSGTVQFTGSGNQGNFADGTRQFSNLIVNAGVNPGFSIAVTSLIPISGNFTNNSTTLINTASATFIFNGSGNQGIYSATAGIGATFGNLQVIKTAGTLSLQSNCNMSGDILMSNGTFDLVTYTANRSSAGGTLTLSSGAALLLQGTTGGQPGSNFPLNFTTINLAASSSVTYNGANQQIASIVYGNLTLAASSGAVVKTMPVTALTITGNLTSLVGSGTAVSYSAASAISIAGNFIIGPGTTFIGGVYTHTLSGNFISNGNYVSTANKMVLNGTASQTITTFNAFNILVLDKASGMVNIGADISINDSLIFLKGNIRTGADKIVLAPAGTIAGAGQFTGWVFGRLQKNITAGNNITGLFEVGDSLAYAPAYISLGTVASAGTVVVKVTRGDHPLLSGSLISPQRSVNRHWTFVNIGTVFSSGVFTFNWAISDLDPGAQSGFFKVATYGGTWDTAAVANAGNTSIQATGIMNFTDFAIGEICNSGIAGTWTGGVSSDWNEPENWRCGILPDPSISILVPAGLLQYPVLNSGIASVMNIFLEAGTSLTVSSSALQIGGIISGNGTFNVSGGALEFNGTTLQTIPAGVFAGNLVNDLTVNNLSGVDLAGTLDIAGILKVNQGNFNTGGFLTLLSTAIQTALIDGSGNGNVTGTLTMQRFLSSGFGYKYFSSPFQSATVNEFSDDLDLLASFPPFYRYDENLPSSGWINYSDPGALLQPLAGYAANFGNVASPKTVDVTGVVNNNTQSASLFNNNRPYTLGFNLVGNPFPSPVDWDAAGGWSRINIDDAIYYFDAGSSDSYGGTYSSYINGVSSNGIAGNLIPSMQGFFVHVSDGTYPVAATLQIDNVARTTDLQPIFHRSLQTETRPVIRMNAAFSDAGSFGDALVIYFDNTATSIFDKDKDAFKLMNTDAAVPSLYSFSSDAARLSINAISGASGSNTIVPLGIHTKQSGSITFKTLELERIPDSLNVYLSDTEKHINRDLRRSGEYTVSLERGIHENRFRLIFTTGDLPHISDTDGFGVYSNGSTIYIYINQGATEKGELAVCNLHGQILYSNEYTGSGNYTLNTRFSDGIYMVSYRTDKSSFSKKLFLSKE